MANASGLYAAASLGEIDTIYSVIEQNPRILEEIDALPFVNTPLHTAASAAHVEFSIEIMRLKPSFGWKLNEQGFSPIHLALQNNNQHNLVRRLVEINNDLVRVKGRKGLTPLHFVCESGDSEENMTLLKDLLKACPDSIKDVNVRNETALHIALINGNLSAFRELVRWLATNVRKDADSLEESVLNWKDSDGNTILHIAILHDNEQAVDLLLKKMVDTNARNLTNQTALDLAEARPSPRMKRKLLKFRKLLNFIEVVLNPVSAMLQIDDDYNLVRRSKSSLLPLRVLVKIQRLKAQISEEQRNAYMVVATLIVTAIYQTVLSPPGGLTQGGDNAPSGNNLVNATSSLNSTPAGKSVMPQKVFYVVTFLNSYVFLAAIAIIIWMLPKSSPVFSTVAAMSLLIFVASYLVSESVVWP